MALNLLNSPFDEKQTKLINELIPTLTEYQKIWLSGYLSAAQTNITGYDLESAENPQAQDTIKTVQQTKKEAAILYGSQTGNAKGVAEKLKAALEGINVEVTLSSMSDFKTKDLKKLKTLLIVTSTHGEGEPPDNALSFYNFLFSKRAPKLDGLKFSVLSLGDSSYEFFCKTGIDFDEQLEKLGAKRIVNRIDCDLDYESDAERWISEVLAAISEEEQAPQFLPEQNQIVETNVTYNKNNPFYAEVLESINLNGRGSNKHTQHIELSIEGSGLTYEPGDCVGIIPENDPNLVTGLIQALGFDADKQVTVKDETLSLEEALRKKLEITVLTKPLLQKFLPYSQNSEFTRLVEDEKALKDYIYGRDLLDVVETFGPFNWDEQQFVNLLRKIPARLYSIASSQKAAEDEIHLTIGKVFYEKDGRERLGVTSGQVTERIEIGDTLPIYIHKNPNFKLPESSDTPIIMICAGTGIAPFRAFLEERAEIGAEGKSWLFFGEQHFRTDFLYQTELQRHLKEGTLTKISLAFSRDQEEKIYVQHRLLENAKEVYEWLEEGAVLYVCGDEKGMAHGVHEALIQIIKEQGYKSEEEAIAYVNELKQQKRYQRDVY